MSIFDFYPGCLTWINWDLISISPMYDEYDFLCLGGAWTDAYGMTRRIFRIKRLPDPASQFCDLGRIFPADAEFS
jgi:hypothetical protein